MLTKNLVQAWHVADFLVDNLLVVLVEDPEVLLIHLDTADVGVRSDQNVLQLSFLLIDLLDISIATVTLRANRLLLV